MSGTDSSWNRRAQWEQAVQDYYRAKPKDFVDTLEVLDDIVAHDDNSKVRLDAIRIKNSMLGNIAPTFKSEEKAPEPEVDNNVDEAVAELEGLGLVTKGTAVPKLET